MTHFDPTHRAEGLAIVLRTAERLRERVEKQAKDIPQEAAFQAYVLLLQKARELGYRHIWQALERWR